MTETFAPLARQALHSKSLVRRLLSKPLARNALALASAEFSTRLSRIIAMVFVARTLTPEMFGFAALALTAHELIKAFTQNGVFQFVVKSSDDELASTAARGQQLVAIFCYSAAALQVIAGAISAALLKEPDLLLMSMTLAAVFLIMPHGVVKMALSARENRLHLNARVTHRQLVAENALMLGLALAGGGAWSLVLPKALSMPIWLHCARSCHNWSYDPRVEKRSLQDFREFCAPLFASELIKTARNHLDKAVIFVILGVDALGVYFFAINAGLGLSMTFAQAVASCLMPHLCTHARGGHGVVAYWRMIVPRMMAAGFAIFSLQAIAANYYVPFVYGDQWAEHAALVVVLCLAALPRFLTDCTAQLLRATGSTRREAATTLVVSISSLTAVAFGAAAGGLLGAAIALVIAAWTTEFFAAWRNYRATKKVMS